eukprot:2540898-Amphidinium_carterae.2
MECHDTLVLVLHVAGSVWIDIEVDVAELGVCGWMPLKTAKALRSVAACNILCKSGQIGVQARVNGRDRLGKVTRSVAVVWCKRTHCESRGGSGGTWGTIP